MRQMFFRSGHYEEREPQKKNIYLESGRPCEIEGIYRYDEQVDPGWSTCICWLR
jgi:hypothetical protein